MSEPTLADELVGTPTGAAFLAAVDGGALEGGALRGDRVLQHVGRGPATSASIDRAVTLVRRAGFFDLMAVAVQAAEELAGPYGSESPSRVARALRLAPTRGPIAEAVVDRFRDDLDRPMHRSEQQWWNLWDLHHLSPVPLGERPHPGRHHAWLTAPVNWFFTVGPTPAHLEDVLEVAWDATVDGVSRWVLEVPEAARVFEIQRPADWARLVADHPCDTRTGHHEGWELSGRPASRGEDVAEILDLPGQRSVRRGVRRFLEPDWTSVADRWDAVHLSWAGFLTTEGTAIDLAPAEVAMLRGWGSERTVWLNPVLSNPRPIVAGPDDEPVPYPLDGTPVALAPAEPSDGSGGWCNWAPPGIGPSTTPSGHDRPTPAITTLDRVDDRGAAETIERRSEERRYLDRMLRRADGAGPRSTPPGVNRP